MTTKRIFSEFAKGFVNVLGTSTITKCEFYADELMKILVMVS